MIETIGEIIDDRMLNQNHCNCSLASTKTGGLFSCNFGQNNIKTFDPVEVNKLHFLNYNKAVFEGSQQIQGKGIKEARGQKSRETFINNSKRMYRKSIHNCDNFFDDLCCYISFYRSKF